MSAVSKTSLGLQGVGKSRQALWLTVTIGCAWASLVSQMVIIVTGVFVRVTASGLGCPTWPECMPGSYAPVTVPATAYHAWVEFGNRLLTFAVAFTALASLASYLKLRRGRDTADTSQSLMWLASSGLTGTMLQALIGGISVRTHLSPAWVTAHFLVSCAILVAQTRYVHMLTPVGSLSEMGTRVGNEVGARLATVLVWCAGATVVVGTLVTGSGPHAGDINVTGRYPFAPVMVTSIHAVAAGGILVCTLALLRRSRAHASRLRTNAATLLALILAQGVVGYVQFRLALPPLMVVAHVAIAVAIWVGALRIRWSLSARETILQ